MFLLYDFGCLCKHARDHARDVLVLKKAFVTPLCCIMPPRKCAAKAYAQNIQIANQKCLKKIQSKII